jgi:hypothetical protein
MHILKTTSVVEGLFEEALFLVEEASTEVVVVISKILTGTTLGQDVDKTTILETLHLSILRLNSNFHRNIPYLKKAPRNDQIRPRRTVKTSFDRWIRISKSRTRMKSRRKMKRRCHLQAGHLPPDRRVNKTLQNIALHSKLLLKLPLRLRNPKLPRNSM